jgi:hypothetical protein
MFRLNWTWTFQPKFQRFVNLSKLIRYGEDPYATGRIPTKLCSGLPTPHASFYHSALLL